MKKFNFIKGRLGESIAEKYLKKNKYKILKKNYKVSNTETDIIATKNGLLIFIEVKSRKTLEFGRPSESVDINKIKKLRFNAELFLSTYKGNYRGIRFDVLEVNLNKNEVVNHIKFAF